MYITVVKANKFKKFSYILVICNNKNKPLRKLGNLFYSTILKKFVIHVDMILLFLSVVKGLKFDVYFFFILSKFTNFKQFEILSHRIFNYKQ